MDNTLINYTKITCADTNEELIVAVDQKHEVEAAIRLSNYSGSYAHAILEERTLDAFVSAVLGDIPHEIISYEHLQVE